MFKGSNYHADNKLKQRLQIITGSLVIAIGAAVAGGYLFDIPLLAAPAFGLPVQFNASICLILLGAGLIALTIQSRSASIAFSTLALAIALLSFLQYVTGISVGIDSTLGISELQAARIYPGRIYPDTAAAMTCAAIALISFNFDVQKFMVVAALRWLSIVPLVFSLMALGYYAITGTDTLLGGNLFMPLNAAIALLLLALGMVPHMIVSMRQSGVAWFNLKLAGLFTLGVVASFSIWASMHAQQYDLLEARLQEAGEELGAELGRTLVTQLLAVDRVTQRWEVVTGASSESAEQRTAIRNILRERDAIDALVMMNAEAQVLWVESADNFALSADDALFRDPRLIADLQAAAASGEASGLALLRTGAGIYLFETAFPLPANNGAADFLVALIGASNLLDSVVTIRNTADFHVVAMIDNETIYDSATEDSSIDALLAWTEIPFQGVLWRLGVSPQLEFAQAIRSSVAEGILALGLTVSLLLSWSGSQQHQLRAVYRDVAAANNSLREEIAARDLARDELRQEETYNRLLLDSTAEGIYGLDKEGACTFCNAACLRLLGYDSEEELIGRQMHNVIHHSHKDGTGYPIEECKIYQALSNGEPVYVDNEVYWRKDKTSFPVEYWAYPMREEGAIVGSVVTFLDLTIKHAAQTATLRSETRFQETFQQAAVGIAHVAPGGACIRVNQRFCDILGYQESEMLALTFRDITHPEDLGSDLALVEQLRDGTISNYSIEKRYISKNGNIVWAKLTVSLVRLPDGTPDYYIAVVEDITQRLAAEDALRASEERFYLAARGTNDGLWDWDIATGAVWYAARFKELLGYADQDEFPHEFATFEQHLHPEDNARTMETLRLHLEEQQPYDVEYRLRTRSGQYRWFRARGESIADDAGRPVRMAGSIQDVTSRRELVDSLRRTNQELERKSQEVEAFVYIVSHDLRAPLVNIQGFCHELVTACDELKGAVSAERPEAAANPRVKQILEGDIPDALRYITAATSRFERLIDSLLQLSRTGRQEYQYSLVDVNALLENIVVSLAKSIEKAGATVTLAAVPPVHGDHTALEQVFGNLLINALNYLDPQRPGEIAVGGQLENGNCHYWVTDNGLGLPAGAEERLFRIFQRFHPHRVGGEGMGLAIVKRVIERHDGKVWVERNPEAGITVHLIVPSTVDQPGKTQV